MFKDIDPKAWYAKAVEIVVDAGLMGGYPDGLFRPNEYLTRSELASVLSRYLYRDGVFTDILPNILPCIVKISAITGAGTSAGSGVSIGTGQILTCAHVVKDAQKLSVETCQGAVDGKTTIASAVPGEDLALITIPIDLPGIKFASDVSVGEPVAVIGFPLAITKAVTVGVISALEQGGNEEFHQLDAPINPGNSGGPVVNEKGELVGIATAKVVGVNVEGFGYITNLKMINSFLSRI